MPSGIKKKSNWTIKQGHLYPCISVHIVNCLLMYLANLPLSQWKPHRGVKWISIRFRRVKRGIVTKLFVWSKELSKGSYVLSSTLSSSHVVNKNRLVDIIGQRISKARLEWNQWIDWETELLIHTFGQWLTNNCRHAQNGHTWIDWIIIR